MKLTLCLLAVLVACGSSEIVRGKISRPLNTIDQQWASEVPEINQHKIQEKTYKDGAEYRYLYDGQILTGMPDIHLQFSGARIRAIVKIQTGAKDIMQIEKVFVGSLHERFVSDPQTLIQLDAFEPMQEQDAPFEEVLKKPVRFTIENGKVGNMEFVEDEPSWSINIKSAILATFHLSLLDKEMPKNADRMEAIKSSDVKSRTPKPTGSNVEDKYFTVIEDGIAGRCEVSYLVLEQPDMAESVYPMFDNENVTVPPRTGQTPVLNVTKTFDYRNCEYRPFVFQGLHLSSACPTCESNPEDFFDILESAAHTRYNISGKLDKSYLIESAITEAVYKITPRSLHAGSMVAYTNITLVLIQSGPKTAPVTFPEANANLIDGLHMINPHFVRKDGDKFLYESPEASRPIVQKKQYWPNVEEKPRKIKAIFEKLVQGMEAKEIDSDTANLVEEIVHLLEYAFDEELVQIHNEIKTITVQGVEKEEIEHLFTDLLVSTGSNCTFTYLKKLITEKKIQGPVVNDILSMLSIKMHVNKISPAMLKQFSELCQHESIDTKVFHKRACWLSFATLVHKGCGHTSFDDRVDYKLWKEQSGSKTGSPTPRQPSNPESRQGKENKRCPTEVRKMIVDKVVQKLKSVGDNDEEKILLIKVIGAMGLPETAEELATIATDMSEPIYIRTQAIYAMRYFGVAKRSEKLVHFLLPLYRDSKNPTQIRIAAFLSIAAARPELPVLQDIAQSLNREVDIDVASYVYSSLSSMANCTDPCMKNVSRDAHLALQLTVPINVEWRHSKAIHKGHYIPEMKSGLFLEINRIMDKDAPAPRAGNFRLHANVNDKSMDLISFGWETEGWGDMFRKYFGNFTEERINEVATGRAPARRPRATEELPVQTVDEIDSLLKFKPMEPKPIRGSAYVKIFGQETRFVVINPQTVSRFIVDLVSQGDTVMPKLLGEGLNMDQRRASLLVDAKLEFPTVLGVPIGFNLRVPVVAGIKGKLKVQMTPKPTGDLASLKTIPQQFTLETDVQTTIAGEIHAKMSVYLGFLRIGTGIRTRMSMNMPMDGKVEFSLKDMMTKVTMDMPENPIKLVKMQSYPLTFVKRYSKNSPTYQPKPIPQGLEGRPTTDTEHTDDLIFDEETPRQPQQTSTTPKPIDRFLSLTCKTVPTDLITKVGLVKRPDSFTGLPVVFPELWEIASPAFIKSRETKFQVGHETMAFKMELKSKYELPVTTMAPVFLPTVGSKCEMEVKLTPKSGVKKMVLSVFERSTEVMTKPEQEIWNKLKDKVEGIPYKDLTKSNVPADYEKFAKIGHSLQWVLNTDGSDAVTSWSSRGLLALIYTMDGRYAKFGALLESKVPVLAKKLSFHADMRYPDRTGMWFPTPQETLNKSIQGQSELFWGDDFTAEKMIKMRVRYQKTENQMKIEKGDLYDVNGIPIPFSVASQTRDGQALFDSLFTSCEEDRKVGAFFSKSCVDLAIRYADLLRVKFDIEYKNVSPAIKKVLSKLDWMIKGIYHNNVEFEDVDVKNPENKISGVIEYSADRSYMDLKYKTPTENVTLTNIDLPYGVQPCSALFPWTPARLVGLTSMPSCAITGPKIYTFDDVSDWMPLSQCYHVMAKDASDDNLFAVLIANAAKNSLFKKVLVIIEGHRIEFVPKTGASLPTGTPSQTVDLKSLYVVKYNGQELKDAFTEDKAATIPPNTPEDKESLAMVVLMKPESTGNKAPILGLISPAAGFKVFFDGTTVVVLPSPFWKNNLVGLCGQYTGQQWDEKLLPNNTMVEEPVELSRAFMLNAGGCDKEISPIPKIEKRRV